MCGIDFVLENDEEILKINSPRKRLTGPYAVVYKNVPQRWAIVAMDWNDEGEKKKHHTLGIRWFFGKNGNPNSRRYATWLVIPEPLHHAVLECLPMDSQIRDEIYRFLADEIGGNELKESLKSIINQY